MTDSIYHSNLFDSPD